ncbi:hypothetical protein [Massilia sp. TSP1-1-2]|uniref:hypothetical protein n=1 Tax=Massilia sp. TSP1-1-2 TaxID=2804649 RepID=UPI003CF4F021
MYRTTVTLLLSLSILPVGQARADDFCALLARVTNDVPNKFKALRAGPDDTGDYHSSLIFPGAKDCYIANDSDFVTIQPERTV